MERAHAQLAGGRFRFLNEALYTQSGDAAAALFGGQPELFAQYHAGFRSQTAAWPLQPLDVAIAWLHGLPASAAVADFGCGDARLAAAAQARHCYVLPSRPPPCLAVRCTALRLFTARR